MSKFSKYSGLFAEQGDFDIPENYTLGLSFMASPAVRVAFDYQKILYSGVPAIANASNSAGALGAANGKGFGWSDVNVYKLGAEWNYSGNLILRAGVNVGENPIQSRDVTFNILAPGVITTHYTLGGTYAVAKDKELTVAYMYAPTNSVTGPTSSLLGAGASDRDTIKMSQQSLGVQFSWKY
jgi:long-chain fatty acid transport protein